jgi:hypothetical protein
MSKCRSCGADISWIRTTTGKAMPVEGEYIMIKADKEGDCIIITDYGHVLKGYKMGDAYEADDAAFGRVSHFSTCPQAKEWRR